MAKSYDLVIVGSGVAAQTAAARVREAGWKVAVVDDRPFGGTCALRGCDPKKVLLSGVEAVDAVARLGGRGVAGEARVDWPALIAFKRTFTDPVPKKQERHYADEGIDAYRGHARFSGRDAIEVDGERLQSRFFLIASGAKPAPLGIPGEEYLTTSDQFLELEELPQRIVLVGGGYIASEFSHIAERAGAKVTILQREPRLLPPFDPDLVDWLSEKIRALGIDVRTGTAARRIERNGTGLLVHASGSGAAAAFQTDLVVHAAGRIPDVDSLDLATAGVETKDGRLRLNEFLQSVSNPAVYAAGDAAAMGPPLTPVSRHDAKIVAANLLEGNRHKPNYLGVPSVVFTVPPLARVGLTEAQVRERGLRFRVHGGKTSGWYTARRVAEDTAGFKVLVEEGTQRILGAHLLGPQADETINIFGLAIRHGLTADDLKETIFGYPTASSDISYML